MGETFKPARLADLEQVVAWAVAEEQPLEVLGRGSKRAFGRPVEAAARLELDALSGVDMYEPEELVMSAGAGTPLIEIEAMLAERQQELAFEPADYGPLLGAPANAGSIGGTFACNLAGPRRIKAGAARDHLLGLQCVTGHGQVIKTGGRVVKNVTGYDLCKLLCGSFGTLAVMSHLTFKVLPAAAQTATLLATGAPEPVLLEVLRQAMGTSADVSAAAMLPAAVAARSAVPEVARAGGPVACLRLEGTEPSVAYRLQALDRLVTRRRELPAEWIETEASRRLWREIRDCRLLDRNLPYLWRVSCPPTDGGRIAEAAAALAPELVFDWAGGLVWIAHGAEREDVGAALIRGALAAGGGHATLIRAPEAVRRAVEVFEPQPTLLRNLAERVKRSFDPKGVLNPGRMTAAY
jgi:glycolate oxidase FAD binding subunit